jgi:putative NADH-flavin reductase
VRTVRIFYFELLRLILPTNLSGKVGSATLQASLDRQIPTIAFLRNPSKLSSHFTSNPLCKTIQGDAKSRQSIASAIRNDGQPVTAVVIAAPYGDMRGRRSGFEEINENVLREVLEYQMEKGEKVKVWIMAGSAVLEHPEFRGRYLNTL